MQHMFNLTCSVQCVQHTFSHAVHTKLVHCHARHLKHPKTLLVLFQERYPWQFSEATGTCFEAHLHKAIP